MFFSLSQHTAYINRLGAISPSVAEKLCCRALKGCLHLLNLLSHTVPEENDLLKALWNLENGDLSFPSNCRSSREEERGGCSPEEIPEWIIAFCLPH